MSSLDSNIERYKKRIVIGMGMLDNENIKRLSMEILDCIKNKRKIFVCGNGGSGSNANHIENDFLYGISKVCGNGLICRSLSSNNAVMTCLANDEGYENIFSFPIALEANSDDVLLVLSGSGNSPNIIEAIKKAKSIGMSTYALLGFSGGEAKQIADFPIHFEINDMQVVEDMHMMVAHIISQWIFDNRTKVF